MSKLRLPPNEVESTPVILPQSFSIEIWMRYYQMPDKMTLLSKWSENDHLALEILPNNSLLAFWAFTGNKFLVFSDEGKLMPELWTHIMFVLLQVGRDSIVAGLINLQMAINPNSSS
jgi:hypothetical protein